MRVPQPILQILGLFGQRREVVAGGRNLEQVVALLPQIANRGFTEVIVDDASILAFEMAD